MGVGSHSLLQGIFLTQGLGPGLAADSLPSVPQVRCQIQLSLATDSLPFSNLGKCHLLTFLYF